MAKRGDPQAAADGCRGKDPKQFWARIGGKKPRWERKGSDKKNCSFGGGSGCEKNRRLKDKR